MKNILLLGSQDNTWMQSFQTVMSFKSSQSFRYKRASDIQTMWTTPDMLYDSDSYEKPELPPNVREYYDILLYMINQADIIVANFEDISETTEMNLITAYTMNLIQDYSKFKFIFAFNNSNNLMMDYLNRRHIFIHTFETMEDVIDHICALFYK